MSRRTATSATATTPTPGWRNRIVGAGEEAPDQLLANPANWRIHPRNQQAALAGSLDAVGWVQQVMVNRQTGFVVDGHARVALAISRHEPSVPVLYVDLSPEEEALVLATLDPIGAMATADEAKLNELLAEVTVDDAGLLRLLGDLCLLGLDDTGGLADGSLRVAHGDDIADVPVLAVTEAAVLVDGRLEAHLGAGGRAERVAALREECVPAIAGGTS